MIEFDNVSKSFWTGTQRKVILDQASFRIELGGPSAFLPERHRQTTIINMMCGLEKPDEGVIRSDCRVSFPLGFMGGVTSTLSANENARFIARVYGLDPDYVEAFCRWLTAIDEYFDMPVGTYSAGMRSRLPFSLLLALEFDVYLIDEGMPSTTDAEFNRKAGAVLYDRLKSATVVVCRIKPDHRKILQFRLPFCAMANYTSSKPLEEAKQYYDYTAWRRAPLSHQPR